ncbi:MAG: hypothetical protein U5R14_03950 [Gemmatimonadota bacterium]|nr:hypothetical protein [Gemmatimonadota bacterium]
MRFAYIDSQGNEVGIPSVDALALRIELGAIGPETQLYDAQADRWAPAESHEIFHTLSRDLAGDDFVLPEPPTPSPGPATPEPDAPVEPEEGSDAESGDDGSAPPDEGLPALADDFELTLVPTDGPAAAPEGDPEPWGGLSEAPDEDADDDSEDTAASADLPLDLTPMESAGPTDSGDPDHVGDTDDAGATALPPDTPSAAEEAFEDAPFDFGMPPPEEDDGALELEAPLSFDGEPTEEEDMAGGLDLEPPMSDFDPSAPPAWMAEGGPAREDDPAGADQDHEPVLDFSDGMEGRPDMGGGSASPAPSAAEGRIPDSEVEPGSVPQRPGRRPEGAARPAARRPSRRKRRSRTPLAVFLLMAALGAGGWYGWQTFGERVAPPPPRPPVVIPDIPAELEPPMRDMAEAALPLMFERIESRTFGDGEPAAPSEEWLAGVYLGNASRFASVETFWAGIAELATRLGEEEVEVFHETFTALADSSELTSESVGQVVERADSGFMATRPARLEVYDLLRTVADASLDLHAFLLTHESEISYTPARGFSGNPIEEVVPATEEVGDRMWDLVENITSALDALGSLDRVTRVRLSTVVLERIEEIGIR